MKKDKEILQICIVCIAIGLMAGIIATFVVFTTLFKEEWFYVNWTGFTTVNNTALIEELMTREPYRNPYRGYARVLEGDVVIVYPFLDKGLEFFEVITEGGYVVE